MTLSKDIKNRFCLELINIELLINPVILLERERERERERETQVRLISNTSLKKTGVYHFNTQVINNLRKNLRLYFSNQMFNKMFNILSGDRVLREAIYIN